MSKTTDNYTKTCHLCNGQLEAGYVTAEGLIGGRESSVGSKVLFVRDSKPTSLNLVKAFRQGLNESDRQEYRLSAFRCANCGHLELFCIE